MKDLALTSIDKRQLYNGDWLTDTHILALNKLLAAKFPEQEGLQDPLMLSKCLRYSSGNQCFVQIVHVAGNHWVCVSNKLSSFGVVEVYDSIPHYSTNSSCLRRQVAAILKTHTSSFKLRHVDVQRQVGSSDCALFSLAFATALCMGEDPHATSFIQAALRPHLGMCFESQKILGFPTPVWSRRLGRNRVLHEEKVEIYCVCRLPWDRHDLKRGALVHCTQCKEWYHMFCMDISQDVIDNPTSGYTCKLCSCV